MTTQARWCLAYHEPAPAMPKSGALRGSKILAVDDCIDNRELLTFVLGMAGADVTAAASAKEALELARSTRFDVVVSDIAMPQHDGIELVGWLRDLHGADLVAIALSGQTPEAFRRRALDAGYDDFVSKPVSVESLIERIVSLRRHRVGA
jgi:CheY-like chemotaxis protein